MSHKITRRVDETAAGKSIAAYVILKKGKLVAKVTAHYASTGSVLVNVWDTKDGFQAGHATGYGYDKFTAALSGLTIDGITMVGHGHIYTDQAKKALKEYNRLCGDDHRRNYELGDLPKWKKQGISFANWSRDTNRYTTAYVVAGLDALKIRGYDVIQAI